MSETTPTTDTPGETQNATSDETAAGAASAAGATGATDTPDATDATEAREAPATSTEAPAASAAAPVDPLDVARRDLASPLKETRERAETTLLAARERAVPFLIAALLDEHGTQPPGSVSPVPRVALFLGAMRAREALPALYTVVERGGRGDDDLAFVARALGELLEGQDAFDDRARAALEKLAASRDRYTRAFAAQAYGSLGDLRSKARVQALASDVDPWVREKASTVLAKIAEVEAIAQAESAASATPIDFAAAVAQTEAQGGPLKPFLDDLGDVRRPVRDAAVAELVRAGKSAVPFLLEKLNQPQTRARIGAALALGRLQVVEAAGPLIVAATAPASTPEEEELRAVALRALAGCLTGQEEGLAASLLPLARDKDRFVRAAALLCLGRLADRAGLKAIVDAIVEDDPFVVESAAVALSEGAREEDVDIVVPLLGVLERRPEPRAAVKEAILLALSRVNVESPALRVRIRHRVRRDVNGQTASTRKAAIVLLERLFADDNPPPLPLVDDVLLRLHDDHPEVRVVAASFLRTHVEPGMTGAVPKLASALRRGELTVSLLVLEALRRHDTADAKAALESARASDAIPAVSTRAAELLQGYEPKTSTWVFVPRSSPPPIETPARPESQRTQDGRERPSRVKPATSDGKAKGAAEGEQGGDRDTVDARFDGEPR